jgi:hypothetical protein
VTIDERLLRPHTPSVSKDRWVAGTPNSDSNAESGEAGGDRQGGGR